MYITFTKVGVYITVPKVCAVCILPSRVKVYYLHEGKCVYITVYYRTKGLRCVYITFTKVGVYITVPKVCASVYYLHEGKCGYYRT